MKSAGVCFGKTEAKTSRVGKRVNDLWRRLKHRTKTRFTRFPHRCVTADLRSPHEEKTFKK